MKILDNHQITAGITFDQSNVAYHATETEDCEVNNIKPYYTFMFEHDKEMLLDDDIGESWAWKHLRKNIIMCVVQDHNEYRDNRQENRKDF